MVGNVYAVVFYYSWGGEWSSAKIWILFKITGFIYLRAAYMTTRIFTRPILEYSLFVIWIISPARSRRGHPGLDDPVATTDSKPVLSIFRLNIHFHYRDIFERFKPPTFVFHPPPSLFLNKSSNFCKVVKLILPDLTNSRFCFWENILSFQETAFGTTTLLFLNIFLGNFHIFLMIV